MLFSSFSFIFVFLPIVLAVALRFRGQRLLSWLTIASFVFYSFAGHAWFLLPMLFTTLLDFFMAPKIAEAKGQKKKSLLVISLFGNLGLLFYFKYSGLLVDSVSSVLGREGWGEAFRVILPAGISFYTFQTLSYIIDVYRGHAKPERNFWLFTGFVSFFPHLVAGPLTRHNQLIPSLRAIAKQGIQPRWRAGLFLFTVGIAKKILVADRIANLIDPLIAAPGEMTMATAWMALLGYTLQIYFDFSGYSDMAIGLGRLFGIELPQNFNSPYQAKDPSDFWRRWHMSLSAWLRDYLYVSLGGNRCSPLRKNFNLMATMVLGGLWHGANWTFAAWGFYHGALLVVFHLSQGGWKAMPVAAQRGLTFVLVAIGWLFFRAESFAHAGTWFAALFRFTSLGATVVNDRMATLALLLACGLTLVHAFRNASTYEDFERLGRAPQFALGLLAAASLLLMNYSSRFLYFQF